MKSFYYCILSSVFVIMSLIAKAQDPTSNFDYTRPPIVIPPSPDVASLMKFTDEPISYYTGTPQTGF
jgi:hypothetical protein